MLSSYFENIAISLETKSKLLELGFEVAKQTNSLQVYLDRALICRSANNAFADWFGIAPEEMIGNITAQTLLGSLFDQNLPYISEVLNGKIQVFECAILTVSGETRNSIVTCCPDFENGEVNGFYVQIVDITFLKTKPVAETINTFAIGETYLSDTEKQLNEVEKTLKACLLTGFPGISKLSKLHFISESKLKRDFKKKYNRGIFSYYRHLQMQLANKYLREKKYNKKQVALMLNFSNPSNFSACYLKYLNEKK